MRLSVRNSGRYSYIVFASETVVFDDYGKPVINAQQRLRQWNTSGIG